jgi:hypothetical protein
MDNLWARQRGAVGDRWTISRDPSRPSPVEWPTGAAFVWTLLGKPATVPGHGPSRRTLPREIPLVAGGFELPGMIAPEWAQHSVQCDTTAAAGKVRAGRRAASTASVTQCQCSFAETLTLPNLEGADHQCRRPCGTAGVPVTHQERASCEPRTNGAGRWEISDHGAPCAPGGVRRPTRPSVAWLSPPPTHRHRPAAVRFHDRPALQSP